MPTSVSALFSRSSLSIGGQVGWGGKVLDDHPGVYVVSVSPSPDETRNQYGNEPPIDLNVIREWINRVPRLALDGKQATPNELWKRLAGFWLSDEPILYIGKAGTSLRTRIGQYFRTPLGDKRPHAGGHWLKTLSVLDGLHVHWALTSRADEVEDGLLKMFVAGVSKGTRKKLLDPDRPFPFANLEYPNGNRKAHGINGAVNR